MSLWLLRSDKLIIRSYLLDWLSSLSTNKHDVRSLYTYSAYRQGCISLSRAPVLDFSLVLLRSWQLWIGDELHTHNFHDREVLQWLQPWHPWHLIALPGQVLVFPVVPSTLSLPTVPRLHETLTFTITVDLSPLLLASDPSLSFPEAFYGPCVSLSSVSIPCKSGSHLNIVIQVK